MGHSMKETTRSKEKSPVSIVPAPAGLGISKGAFIINKNTVITAAGEARDAGKHLSGVLKNILEITIPVTSGKPDGAGAVILSLNPAAGNGTPESYSLIISSQEITLKSPGPAGLIRGIQTLRQLALAARNPALSDALAMPCLEITDFPRFSWRGLNLDCSRHFPSKEKVLKIIDLMALYKLNVLHLHLTDDQGWRLEIKKYPRLTEIGAWRADGRGGRYGGFYTRADIRDIVEYAARQHITVVPEIEMPGHCRAALAAYPEYSCTGGPFTVSTRWGIHKEVFCAGKEETFRFLEDILDEVMEMFPSDYIHAGGDECLKVEWRRCPHCRERIASEKLKDEKELQSYFMKRMERFISSRGKKMIGWDEIIDGGLPPGATVQSWRGFRGAIVAAASGHDTIVSPTGYTYFDYPPVTTPLEKVYSFDPVPEELGNEIHPRILGSEACMWTEFTSPDELHTMLFPRLLALSETLWSPKSSLDYPGFLERARTHYPLLKTLGVMVGPETEPWYMKYKYQHRLSRIFFTIFMEDRETAIENFKLFYESSD